MKKHTLEQLGDASLSVKDVARSQGVTPRYVQMLFEREGKTFSSFLLLARLALAHRRLSDCVGGPADRCDRSRLQLW